MLRAVTANRLHDGRVVFLTPAGGWVEQLDQARTAEAAEAEALLTDARAAEAACQVIGAYLIDVRRDGDHVVAADLREAIRATGPTVRPDLR